MTRDEVIQAFNAMRVWQSGDRRAVHEPLLVLLALSRVNDACPQTMDWNEAEPLLKALLEEFGPDGSSNTRHYPFWHLQTDGIWHLATGWSYCNSELPRSSNADYDRAAAEPCSRRLHRVHLQRIEVDPELVAKVAQRIVNAHFPETIRSDVLDAVGLTQVETMCAPRDPQRRLDPAFRANVLPAYQYRCAVCGHDLRMGQHSIGLELPSTQKHY